MRFQIASDLHLEVLHRFPAYRAIEPAPDADALILAGDIHSHTHGIELFAGWPVPLIYVHGNHEADFAHYWGLVRELRRRAADLSIHYLERADVTLSDVRILGCCMWTDYAVDGHSASVMHTARNLIPDHQRIRVGKGKYFEPENALAEHRISRAWLDVQLKKPFNGRTIVVTHHAPHPNSLQSGFAGTSLNGAFASDLSSLMRMADVWVHGHLHESSDYMVNECRVIANPRGYPRNLSSAASPSMLKWENEAFNPALVVEV